MKNWKKLRLWSVHHPSKTVLASLTATLPVFLSEQPAFMTGVNSSVTHLPGSPAAKAKVWVYNVLLTNRYEDKFYWKLNLNFISGKGNLPQTYDIPHVSCFSFLNDRVRVNRVILWPCGEWQKTKAEGCSTETIDTCFLVTGCYSKVQKLPDLK